MVLRKRGGVSKPFELPKQVPRIETSIADKIGNAESLRVPALALELFRPPVQGVDLQIAFRFERLHRDHAAAWFVLRDPWDCQDEIDRPDVKHLGTDKIPVVDADFFADFQHAGGPGERSVSIFIQAIQWMWM